MQSPSREANWFAASQEIPRILWNPKVHYRTHKRPPPVPVLGQPNPVHISTSHLLEIHRNIIHPSTPRSPQWSLSVRFPHQDPIRPLSSPIRATCPAHLILLDFIPRAILGEEYRSFSSSLCSLLHSPVTSSGTLYCRHINAHKTPASNLGRRSTSFGSARIVRHQREILFVAVRFGSAYYGADLNSKTLDEQAWAKRYPVHVPWGQEPGNSQRSEE